MRFLSAALGFSLMVSASLFAPATAGHHKSGEGHGASSNKGQNRFSTIDSDGNGTVSEAEFMAVAAKRFAKMDANGDGVLSQDEMKRRPKKR